MKSILAVEEKCITQSKSERQNNTGCEARWENRNWDEIKNTSQIGFPMFRSQRCFGELIIIDGTVSKIAKRGSTQTFFSRWRDPHRTNQGRWNSRALAVHNPGLAKACTWAACDLALCLMPLKRAWCAYPPVPVRKADPRTNEWTDMLMDSFIFGWAFFLGCFCAAARGTAEEKQSAMIKQSRGVHLFKFVCSRSCLLLRLAVCSLHGLLRYKTDR